MMNMLIDTPDSPPDAPPELPMVDAAPMTGTQPANNGPKATLTSESLSLLGAGQPYMNRNC